METKAVVDFDIDRYMRNQRRSTSAIESHTVIYVRDLLATRADRRSRSGRVTR